jgi:hypothetical protein
VRTRSMMRRANEREHRATARVKYILCAGGRWYRDRLPIRVQVARAGTTAQSRGERAAARACTAERAPWAYRDLAGQRAARTRRRGSRAAPPEPRYGSRRTAGSSEIGAPSKGGAAR